MFVRTPPQRARASRGPDPAPPRGKDVGPPATRSRSYRYITTLANPGVQVVPHPHPPGRTEPHPRDTHTPNEGTPTNKHYFESAQFPGGLSFRTNPFWSFGFCDIAVHVHQSNRPQMALLKINDHEHVGVHDQDLVCGN